MKKIFLIRTILCFYLLLTCFGCKKDFLDAKPATEILQPTTLDDFQSLLENYNFLNISPALATMAADEYDYISYPIWQSARTATERNSYIWASDIYEGETDNGDWSIPYQSIFYANNVLAGLEKIKNTEKNISRWNNLKGWALFTRAFAYYELVSNFSPAYDSNTAATDLGIPLKLKPSIDETLPRASVQQTYERIFLDLQSSILLLDPALPASNRNRATRVAAYALFARICLSMRKYERAELYADSTLQLYDKLIDYNTVSQTSNEPFSPTNNELIFWKSAVNSYAAISVFSNFSTIINPTLIASFDENDLRLYTYFMKQGDASYIMKISYTGFTSIYPFTGLATDEVYLIKAECAARRNDKFTALTYLNDLLIKRYRKDSFTEIATSNSTEVLDRILSERKKELIWRNLRWSDLKRLNKEGANIALTRQLNGQIFKLMPNDDKYVFPIPNNEISLGGIKQNKR